MFSVIIPWRNRDELEVSLTKNLPFFLDFEIELLIVNMGGDMERLSQLISDSGIKDSKVNLRVVTLYTDFFNKSFALNWGLKVASLDKVFVLDADIILEGDVFIKANEALNGGNFVNIGTVIESEQKATKSTGDIASVSHYIELEFQTDKPVKILTNKFSFSDNSRSAPGLLFAERKHLLDIGGFDSDLQNWGWEDLDVIVRLQTVCQLSQVLCGSVVHLSHGDDSRDLTNINKTDSENINFNKCMKKYKNSNFSGSYIRDTSEDFKQYVKECAF